MAHPAQAYYLTQSPEPFTMRGKREEAPPSDKKGVFTVQDNFNLFTRNDGSSPILLPHSDYFIAADTIDINIPIFSIFSQPARPSEDPLANMLYANLQIKKLLEEYAAIQGRAEELLSSAHTTMPSGKMATFDSTKKPTSIPHEKSPGDQQTIKQELDQVQTRLSSINSTGTGPATLATTQNNKHQPASKKLILTFRELQSQVAMQPLNTPSAKTGKTATHNKFNKNLYDPDQNTPRASSQNKSSYADTGEISLPWIIELPFKIFNYMLAHKITALVVCFFLLLLFNFIFGSRS